jgi:hypothetical protein
MAVPEQHSMFQSSMPYISLHLSYINQSSSYISIHLSYISSFFSIMHSFVCCELWEKVTETSVTQITIISMGSLNIAFLSWSLDRIYYTFPSLFSTFITTHWWICYNMVIIHVFNITINLILMMFTHDYHNSCLN